MTRKDFIKLSGILGIGLPFQTVLHSCGTDDEGNQTNFEGKVIIIGAGAGGLSAAYLLHQSGIEVEILEASANYGGRIKINTDFTDFPIPLGAEWLHASTDVFQDMVNDDAVSPTVSTINYNSNTDTYGSWENGELTIEALGDNDIKFVGYSWFNFYEEYIVPSIADKITYNTIVQSIDYSGDEVVVTTQNGEYRADRVIVSVPLKVLQDGDISFSPALPNEQSNLINEARIWDGFKAFIEFSEKFYPTQLGFEVSPETDGQKLYYDAAYGQDTGKHILGLFTIGTPASVYSSLTDAELKDFILAELDEIFDNQATPSYIKHLAQNWNDEPFIKGGYLTDHANWRAIRDLSKSVANKVYFAGGAYTNGEDWVSIHAAAQSAKDAVGEIVG